MPFIELPEHLKRKIRLDGFSAPVLVGIISLVLVVLAFSIGGVVQAVSGDSLEVHKDSSLTMDGGNDPKEDQGSDSGKSDEVASSSDKEASSAQDAAGADQSQGRIVVYVCGSVKNPGVYELPEGSRCNDAVKKAGGFAADAVKEALNLAKPLQDGEQVLIPSVDDIQAAGVQGSNQQDGAQSNGSSLAQPAGLININTASESDLTQLPGIGQATAAKIVASRDSEGPFMFVEDLKRVSGIGDKKFEALKDLICV